MNVHDGSFLLSKIISEFGIFGILLFFIYFFIYMKVLNIYKMQRLTVLDSFFISFLLLSPLEMFIRGTGYFTPTIYMLVLSIIYLQNKRLI